MREDTTHYGTHDSIHGGERGMQPASMARLGDLDDYKVADGEPDVRGWTAATRDGRNAGKIADLIVDLGALKVIYLEVELHSEALRLAHARRVLVPTEAARLDENEKTAFLGLSGTELIAAPVYDPRSFTHVDHEALQRRYAGHLTRSEEELAVGTRRRMAGKVEVRSASRPSTSRSPSR